MDNNLYIFLDFDGVCTACDATPGSYITNKGNTYGASAKCLEVLKKLLIETNAKIIISSNWRRFDPDGIWHTQSFGDVKNPLPKFIVEFKQFIAGQLPPIRHITKSQALRMWFNENKIDSNTCHYVIFDDDDQREGFSRSEFAEHFIQTNISSGLTDKDCEKAKIILKKNEF